MKCRICKVYCIREQDMHALNYGNSSYLSSNFPVLILHTVTRIQLTFNYVDVQLVSVANYR